MLRTLFAFSVLFAFEVLPLSAQQVRVSGTVASVDPAARTMVMKMDAGPELTVRFTRANVLQAGQRVTVSGRISQDEKAVDAVEVSTIAEKGCKSDTPIHAVLAGSQHASNCPQINPSHTE